MAEERPRHSSPVVPFDAGVLTNVARELALNELGQPHLDAVWISRHGAVEVWLTEQGWQRLAAAAPVRSVAGGSVLVQPGRHCTFFRALPPASTPPRGHAA